METIRYEFIVEAQGPVAHHSESIGNSAIAMRRKVRQADGSWCDVPIITGDTMRHGLREAASYALLDSAGLLGDAHLSESALRLLFAGGMITGKGDASAIKLDQYREMVELVPPLALLGGCANNRSIPGRLIVDDAVLICEESARYLPAWIVAWLEERSLPLDSCRTHLEEVQRVRMDPTLDPGKRKLLSAGAAEGVQSRLLASETASEKADFRAVEATKSTMLPRRFERLAQGSLFVWGCEATCYSELDVDTYHTAIGAFLANARVGGKKATGHGLIKVIAAEKTVLAAPAQRSAGACEIALRVGEAFRQHVAARADRLKEFLASVDA